MKKITLPFLLLLLLIPVLVSAQQKREYIKKAPMVKEPAALLTNNSVTPSSTLADGNYIPIDTMANAFGPADGVVTPLVFDPYAGVIAMVHRGWASGHYAKGSGELWYNISTDFGVSWTRVKAGINTGNTQLSARYPSMTISNPTKGNLSATTAAFSWPELSAATATFGWVGYGADQPVGSGNPAAFITPDEVIQYGSRIPTWNSDNTPWIFWCSDNATNASITLWRTTDYGTVLKSDPPQWDDTVWSSVGNITLGGCALNGVVYAGQLGTFNENYAPNPIVSGWYPGYSKSTDNGATWSDFKVADFRNIPRLAKYDRLFDFKKGDAFVSYQGDINVDKDGHVHLLVQVTDTTIDNNTGTNAIVDIFETNTGWDGTVVYSGLDDNIYLLGPGLGQMGPSTYLAFDTTRNVECVQWVNVGPGGWADVFQSHKLVGDTSWSQPVNLTNSPNINNTQSHMAPYLRLKSKVGSAYTYEAYSAYGYVLGATGPFADTTLATVLYGGAEPFTITITGVNDNVNTVNTFALSQNYPNPFNPNTVINYSLPERNNVSLKVYDMLGREVANLVNESQNAGSHSVSFNASKLASGIYIYTLRTGNNSMSKKMMLMK
jgi:hypothetical protein